MLLPSASFLPEIKRIQSDQSLRQQDHQGFAILKVGPWLTFALLEALYALDCVADVLEGHPPRGALMGVMEEIMLQDLQSWRNYYTGDRAEPVCSRNRNNDSPHRSGRDIGCSRSESVAHLCAGNRSLIGRPCCRPSSNRHTDPPSLADFRRAPLAADCSRAGACERRFADQAPPIASSSRFVIAAKCRRRRARPLASGPRRLQATGPEPPAGHGISTDRPDALADFLERHEAFVISHADTLIRP